jgi:hypothetical protein
MVTRPTRMMSCNIKKFCIHTVGLCVSYIFHNKYLLFLYMAFTNQHHIIRLCVLCKVGSVFLYIN